jgi:hypothetical protein
MISCLADPPDDFWNTFQQPNYADDYGDQLGDIDATGCVAVPEGPVWRYRQASLLPVEP